MICSGKGAWRMKRATAILLLVCMSVNLAFAADSIESLSPEQFRAYISNSLSIETASHTTVSGGSYDFGRPGGYISSYATGDTVTEWYPYLGSNQINRSDFFALAGYDDLARQEYKIEQARKNMSIAKWSIFGIGSAAALIGAIMWSMGLDNYDDAMAETGAIIMLAGLASYIPALVLEFTPPESDIAISFAVGIANQYNRQLLDSI